MRDRGRRAPQPNRPWEIEYYETPTGSIPVLEWIESMTGEEQALALHYIDLLATLGVEEAHRPLVAPLQDKLYELRWKAHEKHNRIAYFAFTGRTFVLLHGIVKKTRAWPKRDLDLAKRRMQDYERRHM